MKRSLAYSAGARRWKNPPPPPVIVIHHHLDLIDDMRDMLATGVTAWTEFKQLVEAFGGEIQSMSDVWDSLSDEEGRFVPPAPTVQAPLKEDNAR